MPLPVPIYRPCDFQLLLAVNSLEVQLGTVEAYNRMVRAAAYLKAAIDAGKAVAQSPCYAVDPSGKE